MNRRTFVASTIASTSAIWLGVSANPASASKSPNEKLNLAFIGVGGQGFANLKPLSDQNLVAFCDVDGVRAKKAFEQFPDVPKFEDYRVMLEKLESKIDGVVISTPDHSHFHPAFQALQMGKHVYLEKPLAHNVWETRTLCDLAREEKVATQLGVQRHTLQNVHRVVELIDAGAIGDVSEVYCWIDSERGMPALPKTRPQVPSHLNYELWLGASTRRSRYNEKITPYGWRFWWSFGTGEPGNWGCHILDIPFWALGLKYPTKVSASGPKVDKLRTPKSLQSTFDFPGTESRGPVTLHWDQAKGGPEILKKHNLPSKGNNTLFIGSEGMLLAGFGQHKLYPEEKFVDYERPSQTIENSPGFHQEWLNACRGGKPATCNFDYSGPMAETVLLSNVAYRSQSSFNWDYKNLTSDNATANELIKEDYFDGWQVE